MFNQLTLHANDAKGKGGRERELPAIRFGDLTDELMRIRTQLLQEKRSLKPFDAFNRLIKIKLVTIIGRCMEVTSNARHFCLWS